MDTTPTHDAPPANLSGGFSPQERAYRQARRAVRALRFWYVHLTVYLAVNALLWTKYLTIGPSDWAMHRPHWPSWPVGPTVFWGIGLLIHGLVVWMRVSRRGRGWEERKIREYLDRG